MVRYHIFPLPDERSRPMGSPCSISVTGIRRSLPEHHRFRDPFLSLITQMPDNRALLPE